jgi:DNA-binding NtrC family response regulator
MTTDHATSRTTVSGAHAALVGVEVLVLDADKRVHAGVEQLLSEVHLHVTCVTDAASALELVDRQFFSVALVDIDTLTPREGIETIRAIHMRSPTTMIIALTPRRSFEDAVDAVRAGAVDLILKAPESVAYLKERVLDAAGRSVGKRAIDSVLLEVQKVHDEFLTRFMEAERRAIDANDKIAGRDDSRMIGLDEMRVMVVDETDGFVSAMQKAKPQGFAFIHVTSGGEALDRMTAQFHYAMISVALSDLPVRTLAKTIRNQAPDTIVLTYEGPGDGGHVDLVEAGGTRSVLKPFTEATQLLGQLDQLAEAWRVKARERRYAQMFREKHYDFVRRYVELKTKIERAIDDGPS